MSSTIQQVKVLTDTDILKFEQRVEAAASGDCLIVINTQAVVITNAEGKQEIHYIAFLAARDERSESGVASERSEVGW